MNRSSKYGFWMAVSSLLVALPAFAQIEPDSEYGNSVLNQAEGLLTQIIPFLIGVAAIIFIWGVVRYIAAGDDPEKKKSGRGFMVYGIIAIVVIVSLWGLVNLLQDITGVNETGENIERPTLPGRTTS